MKDTQKDLDELRQRKAEEAEFSKLMSGTDPFKTLTYRVINLPFAEKYRLIRGVFDGPIVVGHSTSNPHVRRNPEDEMMKMLEWIEMTIRYNHMLLFKLLNEKHIAKSLRWLKPPETIQTGFGSGSTPALSEGSSMTWDYVGGGGGVIHIGGNGASFQSDTAE